MDQIMGGGTIYFYHGKTTDDFRFTIAGRFQDILHGRQLENQSEIDTIVLGAAICSEKDQFCKKVGRIKAEGRMKSNNISGRGHFSLYSDSRPRNWFNGQEQRVFKEAASLNAILSRESFMRKFNL